MDESVESIALKHIYAWCESQLQKRADEWDQAVAKHGRRSPEERRASDRLHDLAGFVGNIGGICMNPGLLTNDFDGFWADLRKKFGAQNVTKTVNSEEEGDDDILEPTTKELRNKSLEDDGKCTFCRPNKGENRGRKPKHPSKPKGRKPRGS